MTPQATTTPAAVPFSKLVPSDDINARAKSKDGIEELAASIAAHGLLTPLLVRPSDGKDKFDIIGGRRRYMALQVLVKAGTLAKTWPVPVTVRNEPDQVALELSLVENIMRQDMHPVDQFRVFARLVEGGATTADIAKRFGIAQRKVEQRLALGKLAPPILDAWKRGKIDEDGASAFTIEPRHDVQAAAYARLAKQGSWGLSRENIRRELSGSRTVASNVRPAILAAYEAAGGKVTKDLFTDDAILEDAALLKKIEGDECEKVLALFRADGWAWVRTPSEMPGGQWWGLDTITPNPDEVFTDAQKARIDKLESMEAKDDAQEAAIEAELFELTRLGTTAAFTKADRKRSGVVVRFHGNGGYEATYGVLLDAKKAEETDGDEDDADDAETVAAQGDEAEDTDDTDEPAGISNALTASLTAAQTKAIDTVLARDPDLAARVLVAGIICNNSWASPVKVSITGQRSNANIATRSEGEFHKVLAKVLALDSNELGKRLADLIASAIDVTAHNSGNDRSGSLALVNALDSEGYLAEMRATFDAANYFNRTTKAHALAAIDEIREAGLGDGIAPEDVLAGMKKGELADVAANLATSCGWLPAELRSNYFEMTAPETKVKVAA